MEQAPAALQLRFLQVRHGLDTLVSVLSHSDLLKYKGWLIGFLWTFSNLAKKICLSLSKK